MADVATLLAYRSTAEGWCCLKTSTTDCPSHAAHVSDEQPPYVQEIICLRSEIARLNSELENLNIDLQHASSISLKRKLDLEESLVSNALISIPKKRKKK